MPLLRGRTVPLVKPPGPLKPSETVFTIAHTGEQFLSKEEFDKRLALYADPVWTCQCTGHIQLTHQEAHESEVKVRQYLTDNFPQVYEKRVLQLVHHSTDILDNLTEIVWKKLQQELCEGEEAELIVNDKTIHGTICKVDRSETTGSNCSSPSSNKENSQEEKNRDKPLILKYGFKITGEGKVVNGVPASDLKRVIKPPTKELLNMLIRARAVRGGVNCSSPWVVQEDLVEKYSLSNKLADLFVSSSKMAELGRKSVEEPTRGKRKLTQAKLTDAPAAKKAKKEEKSDSPKKRGRPKKTDSPTKNVILDENGQPIKRPRGRPRKDGSVSPVKTPKKSTPKKAIMVEDSGSDSEDDIVLSKLKKVVDEDSDSMTLSKIKEKNAKVKKNGPKKNKMKQMTLDDMKPKRGRPPSNPNTPKKETPSKRTPKKSPAKSPYRLPPVAQKLKKILDTQGVCPVYHQALYKCAKSLTKGQILKLPPMLQEPVMKSYEKIQEKKMLEKMTPQEREEYKKKKREEVLRKASESARRKWKESNMKFEDTELDLEPLPLPKLVSTPDGVPNELFGDIAMVSQFISTYRGLLMPDSKEKIVNTFDLMTSLAGDNYSFEYLAKDVMVLLQTLLQDELAEDYSDLEVPLSTIQVTNFTAAELARLALRKKDDKTDDNESLDEEEEEELIDQMPEELMERLETADLFDLQPEDKLSLIQGLCHRVLCTYSLQDYLEERQQLASELWRKRIAAQKAAKNLRRANELKGGKRGRGRPFKPAQEEEKSSGLTIMNFYGHQPEEQQDSEMDLASVVKQRRIRASKAAEEKAKKEEQKKAKLQDEIKAEEHANVERDFIEGTMLAKRVLRHIPIGFDRHHSRYWVFDQTVTPGLYVEKGWAPPEMTYSTRDENVISSSSESESEEDEGKRKKWGHVRDLYAEKTFPHVGQNLWFHFESIDDIDKLIKSLHPLGIREAALKNELKKCRDVIASGLKPEAKTEVKSEDEEVSGPVGGLESAFRQELLELELRIRNGGLGGVNEYQLWETKVKTAETIADLGECLLECQAHVLEKFMQGFLIEVEKKKKAAETEDDDAEEEEVHVGRDRWAEAVRSCPTWSRLHFLLAIMESCMRWEKSAENAKCKICRKKGEEEKLLLCDECNGPYHLYCLRPALFEVPQGEWHCLACQPRTRRVKVNVNYRELAGETDEVMERSSRRSRRNAKYQEESEEEEEEIVHEKECTVCGGDEGLVNCSTCVSAFHLDCHEPPLRHVPRSVWRCMQCKSGVRIKKSKRAAAKRKWYTAEESDDDDEPEEIEPVRKSSRKRTKRSFSPESDDDSMVRTSSRNGASKSASNSRSPVDGPTAGRSTRRSREAMFDPDLVVGDVRSALNRSAENSKEKERKHIQNTLSRLRRHKQGWPFNEPVNTREVPDYLTIVQTPMDLQTIEDKFVSGVYKGAQEFIDDVVLMFDNCDLYNKADSLVGKCLPPLERSFKDCIVRLFPNCLYSRDPSLYAREENEKGDDEDENDDDIEEVERRKEEDDSVEEVDTEEEQSSSGLFDEHSYSSH